MIKKPFLAILAAMFLLSACSSKEVVQNDQEYERESQQGETESTKERYTYPLTGLPTNKNSKNRPIAVMINNHPEARPQSGLHKADIVYEVLAEGDITRFLAIFQSEKVERIGPVRSARDYYIELAKGYDALFIAHGFSPKAKEMLNSGYIDNINGMYYDGSLFKRSTDRKAPHNSYITMENILKGAKEKNYEMKKTTYPLVFLKEDEIEELSGKEVLKVIVSYRSNKQFEVQYEYDPTTEKYTRFSHGEKTIDLDTGEPVQLDNILILETEHEVIDNKGRRRVDLTSGGKAYLLQKGLVQEVDWENRQGRIVPFLNGKEVGFVPGKTWINIVPSDNGLTNVVTFVEEE